MLINNHPYLTAGQPADAALIEPIFHDGRLIGFGALRAHMGDLAAKGPYPVDATELYQEGTLFPGLRLYDEGRLNDTLIKIMRANSRLPAETVGNVLAGAGSLRAGGRKLAAIAEKYGIDTYYAAVDELLDHGERSAREALARIPDGVYVYEDYMDDNGVEQEPVKLKCTITIEGTNFTADMTGSDDQQLGPVNCPWGYTLTTCRFALKRLTTPELPPNGGEQRLLTMIAPEGSVFNPIPPAPTFIGAWTSSRLADMIVQALVPALPDELPAESGGDILGVLAYIKHPVTKRWCFFWDDGGIGHGARKGHDGMTALIHPITAGIELLPLELLETRMPLLKKRFEIVQDSGGPGEFRGGLGTLAEYESLSDGIAVAICEKSRVSPVKGLQGGMPAPYNNTVFMFAATEREMRLGKKSDIPIVSGDEFITKAAGGGGYGDPLLRDPEQVGWDVLNDYVSVEQAESAYGVIMDESGRQVDHAATEARRGALRAEK